MKILFINASPRKSGVTATVLAGMRAALQAHHAVEWINIRDIKIAPCTGCLGCRPDRDCVLPRDGAHHFADEARNADMIIVGAPAYWGNIPGPLKNLFDRNVTTFEYIEAGPMKKLPSPRLRGKSAIFVVASGSPFPFNLMSNQAGGTIRALKTVFKAGGIKIRTVFAIGDAYRFREREERVMRKAKKIALGL
ncbi:MAG: flavodoxin family protein [Spirochaetes bacterium]|nr:MAG: flavodoxin family protein [Spirochaetota bacterium]